MIMWGVEEINKITVIGNLGRDPEMQYIPSGQGQVSGDDSVPVGAGMDDVDDLPF